MKVNCKKCGKFLFEIEKEHKKEVKIICWHCGHENIIKKNDLFDALFGGKNGKI